MIDDFREQYRRCCEEVIEGLSKQEFDAHNLNIFESNHDHKWNACVGDNCCHDMEKYAIGYITGAKILLEAIFIQKLWGNRDNLVHPILYLTRHSVELMIKHVLMRLNCCNIKTEDSEFHNHRLVDLLGLFVDKISIDHRFVDLVNDIKPIITQLDAADPEGQNFRYSHDTDGKQTYQDKRIVDLVSVTQMVIYLGNKIRELSFLVENVVEERKLGLFTSELNYPELIQLAEELPDYGTWEKGEEFENVKKRWKEKLKLSYNAFNRAINFVKSHRELSGKIGLEFDLRELKDSLIEYLVIKSANQREIDEKSEKGLVHLFSSDFSKPDPSCDIFSEKIDELTIISISEIQAIFYLGRDCKYGECYEQYYSDMLDSINSRGKAEGGDALRAEFHHVYDKGNFPDEMIEGLKKIGKYKLAAKLEGLIRRI